MSVWVRDRGLLIANLALFLIFLVGMVLTGSRVYSDDQVEHGHPATTLGQHLTSGDVVEATFENWESEFLQMGMYVGQSEFLAVGVIVWASVYLRYRGSAESKPVAAPHRETGA